MAKRKTKSRGKKNNSFTIFLIIVVILALASFAISYFVMQTDNEEIQSTTKVEKTDAVTKKIPESVHEKLTLEGTWASYNDGAMLTINGPRFSIELPSVESTVLASGRIIVKDNTVTFIYTSNGSECGVKPGVYNFKVNNDEVSFTKNDDSCAGRVGLLVATWFKV